MAWQSTSTGPWVPLPSAVHYVVCLVRRKRRIASQESTAVDELMKRPRILTILIVAGLFGWSLKDSLTVAMNSGKATAVCVSQPRTTTRSSRRLTSIRESRFRFTDEEGQEQTASMWFAFPRPQAGEEVAIRYAKNSPQLIYYDSAFSLWMLPGIFGALLLVPLVKLVASGRTSSDGQV